MSAIKPPHPLKRHPGFWYRHRGGKSHRTYLPQPLNNYRYSACYYAAPAPVYEPDSGQTLSLLETMLPQEILCRITDFLPSEDYLAIQFVCKRFNAATRRTDGSQMETIYDLFYPGNHGYAVAMVEADLNVHLDKLTCSECSKRFGLYVRGVGGFDNTNFNRANRERRCMRCIINLAYPPTKGKIYTIGSEQWICCTACSCFIPLLEAVQNSHVCSANLLWDDEQ